MWPLYTEIGKYNETWGENIAFTLSLMPKHNKSIRNKHIYPHKKIIMLNEVTK